MRPVMAIALLGTTLSINRAEAQNSTEQASSGTAVSKPPATPQKVTSHRASSALFEGGPDRKPTVMERNRSESQRASGVETAPDSTPSVNAPQTLAPPTVQAIPPGPPQKELTGEEFRLISAGSAERRVLEVLGPPSSRVAVPDDDGHLRETLQYWVKGRPMGTVHLDNGRVTQIDVKR